MTKKKFRKIDKLISVAIVSACLSFLALNLARVGFRNYDLREINYVENSEVNYEVYLKENNFFQDDYLPSGMTYVTSLIDYIKINFDYNINFDDNVSGTYSYYIKGTAVASQENSDSKFYTKEYILSDVKTDSVEDTDEIIIDETIDIDYDTYNDILVDFRDEYAVQIEGSFEVVLVIESSLNDAVSGEEATVENEMEIVIPLTTKTVEVSIETEDNSNEGILISTKMVKQGFVYTVLRVIAVICYIGAFVSLLYFIYLTYLSFKLENAYSKKLKKILKVYDSIIVNVKKHPQIFSSEVIEVASFEELIDAHSEIRNPINYIVEKDGALFLLMSEKYVYSYKLNRELFLSGDEKINV